MTKKLRRSCRNIRPFRESFPIIFIILRNGMKLR